MFFTGSLGVIEKIYLIKLLVGAVVSSLVYLRLLIANAAADVGLDSNFVTAVARDAPPPNIESISQEMGRMRPPLLEPLWSVLRVPPCFECAHVLCALVSYRALCHR